MATWKQIIRAVTPPVLLSAAAAVRRPALLFAPAECLAVGESWAAAQAKRQVRGYDDPSVLPVAQRGYREFATQLVGPHGLADPELSPALRHNLLAFAYALSRAARNGQVSLLDFGGGLGHYGLAARILCPNLTVDYHCREVASLAEAGARLHPEWRFFADDACFERTYDLVLASSSLQYVADWQVQLGLLRRATGRFLYVARTPMTEDGGSYVFLQRPPGTGYKSNFLSWCLSRQEFLAASDALGLKREQEFQNGDPRTIPGAPGLCRNLGFLFSTGRAEV